MYVIDNPRSTTATASCVAINDVLCHHRRSLSVAAFFPQTLPVPSTFTLQWHPPLPKCPRVRPLTVAATPLPLAHHFWLPTLLPFLNNGQRIDSQKWCAHRRQCRRALSKTRNANFNAAPKKKEIPLSLNKKSSALKSSTT